MYEVTFLFFLIPEGSIVKKFPIKCCFNSLSTGLGAPIVFTVAFDILTLSRMKGTFVLMPLICSLWLKSWPLAYSILQSANRFSRAEELKIRQNFSRLGGH